MSRLYCQSLLVTVAVFAAVSACQDSTFVAEQGAAQRFNQKHGEVSKPVDVSEETRERFPEIDETADARGPGGKLFPRPGKGTKSKDNPNGTETVFEDIEPIITTCNDGRGRSDTSRGLFTVEKPRNHRVEAMLQGEFCPEQSNKVNVLFIIDFSASMGFHLTEDNVTDSPGNDPVDASGSCGRLNAMRAIIDRLKGERERSVAIEVGMLPFSGNIVQPFIVQPAPLERFDSTLTPEQVCRYVIQSAQYASQGGIDDPRVSLTAGPATNYAAAFDAATNIMRTAAGRNVSFA